MANFTNDFTPKKPLIFVCEICVFKCFNKKDYNRHLLTIKHQRLTTTTKNPTRYSCECGKSYTHSSSLSKHKQICLGINQITPENPNQTTENDDIVKALLKDNQEMRAMIVELVKENKSNIQSMSHSHNTNTTHTNSHNKTFNLQFFLNETCKDAMNISDFVNSLKLTLQDLEKVGELGYAEGISQMFVNGLNDLEVTKRPIHCSDIKREVLHIKDKDKWEKDPNQDKLKRAIKDLSTKNIMLLDDWKQENPGCTEYDNRKNDLYLKMMVESIGPADQTAEKRDFGKIIRTIAKNTIIDKDET